MTQRDKYGILIKKAQKQLDNCLRQIKRAKESPMTSKRELLLLEGMHCVLQQKVLMYKQRMEGDVNACE